MVPGAREPKARARRTFVDGLDLPRASLGYDLAAPGEGGRGGRVESAEREAVSPAGPTKGGACAAEANVVSVEDDRALGGEVAQEGERYCT